jgi:hypothetical protein
MSETEPGTFQAETAPESETNEASNAARSGSNAVADALLAAIPGRAPGIRGAQATAISGGVFYVDVPVGMVAETPATDDGDGSETSTPPLPDLVSIPVEAVSARERLATPRPIADDEFYAAYRLPEPLPDTLSELLADTLLQPPSSSQKNTGPGAVGSGDSTADDTEGRP